MIIVKENANGINFANLIVRHRWQKLRRGVSKGWGSSIVLDTREPKYC